MDDREKDMRQMVEKAEAKRAWFGQFKEWVEGVAGFLDEKVFLLFLVALGVTFSSSILFSKNWKKSTFLFSRKDASPSLNSGVHRIRAVSKIARSRS